MKLPHTEMSRGVGQGFLLVRGSLGLRAVGRVVEDAAVLVVAGVVEGSLDLRVGEVIGARLRDHGGRGRLHDLGRLRLRGAAPAHEREGGAIGVRGVLDAQDDQDREDDQDRHPADPAEPVLQGGLPHSAKVPLHPGGVPVDLHSIPPPAAGMPQWPQTTAIYKYCQ